MNLSDLNNKNNSACFNEIILYCYFVVRTVIKESTNRLVLKKIINELTWTDFDQNLTSR